MKKLKKSEVLREGRKEGLKIAQRIITKYLNENLDEDDYEETYEVLPEDASVDLDLGRQVTKDDVVEAVEANYECEIESYDRIVKDKFGGYTIMGIVWGRRWR